MSEFESSFDNQLCPDCGHERGEHQIAWKTTQFGGLIQMGVWTKFCRGCWTTCPAATEKTV